MRKYFFVMLAVGCLAPAVYADSSALAFDTGSSLIKNSDNLTLLSGGSSATGDGYVVEIGYYSGSTSGNNFSGSWVSIAGGTSLNTAFAGNSIGDTVSNGAGNGTYANTLVFDTTLSNTVVALPSAGQIMTVRFYNAATVGAAAYYAAVSNNTWTWIAPAAAQSNMTFSLSDTGVVWQNNIVEYTGIAVSAVPEPATYAALLGVASLGFVAWRRRRAA